MTTGRIKNWAKFQHYKDRSPPWIKLQKELLDDYHFARLPLASKALAPLLWLLASETQEGDVCIDPEWLAFRLRWDLADIEAGIQPLISKGFVETASATLAERTQRATPETETETETETEADSAKPAAVAVAPAEKRARKKPETRMPEDFGLSDRVRAWAAKNGHGQLPERLASFRLYAESKGKTYSDWDAAFMRAIGEDWAKLNGRGYSAGTSQAPRIRHELGSR